MKLSSHQVHSNKKFTLSWFIGFTQWLNYFFYLVNLGQPFMTSGNTVWIFPYFYSGAKYITLCQLWRCCIIRAVKTNYTFLTFTGKRHYCDHPLGTVGHLICRKQPIIYSTVYSGSCNSYISFIFNSYLQCDILYSY